MAIGLTDLPDDVRALIEPHAAEGPSTLDAISRSIAIRRDEAKSARTSSGIEEAWKDAEEAYVGIDDANRHEYQDGRWSKPMSSDGPVTTGRTPRQTDHKSTVFVRLTARYVDAGAAKLAEILLPADDKAFSFSEMPVPELIAAKEDRSQVFHEGLGVPLTRPAQPGESVTAVPQGQTAAAAPPAGGAGTAPAGVPLPTPQPPPMGGGGAPALPAAAPPGAPAQPAAAPGQPPPVPQVPVTVRDFALEKIEIARKKAKAAETRIYDWMIDCQYQAEMRKVIADSARIGCGVLKAPIPRAKREIAVIEDGKDGLTVQIVEKIAPVVMWVDPWNVFPDPACGENIHDGDFIFERDYMSARQVRALKLVPGYISGQIDRVLEEEPLKADADTDAEAAGAPGAERRKGRYEVWYYYGTLRREEMGEIDKAAGKPALAGSHEGDVYAIGTLINDHVVRATVNPLDSGSFPYHSVPWQRRSQHWAGIGVGEQIKTPQKIVNASMRSLLNNAGKSAGSQIVINKAGIRPADGNWTVTPDKIWYAMEDFAGADVRQAFAMFEIPNVTDQMLKILETGERLGEEATSIPLITQGQSGPTTPDTFGAAQLQNNNANQLLRSIGYSFDDFITEPVVRQYYEWLLLDPEVPNEEKGEFRINAHGSIALVERAIQDQTIGQMGGLVLNPAYGIDPKKWVKMFLKSKRLDPEDVMYTEEEQAKIDAAPPPEQPAVTVAKIAADTAMKQLAAKQTTEQQGLQSEERIAAAANALEGGHVQNEGQRINAERERTSVEQTVKLHEIQAQRELAMLDYANRHRMNLDQVKAALAKTAMTLQAQKELNAADNAADLRKHRREQERPARGARPPDQTPGRAGNGRAFEQGAQP